MATFTGRIAKAGCYEHGGRRLLLGPAELRRAAASFDGAPLVLADHGGRTIGKLGRAEYRHPYLIAPIEIWNRDAIARIRSGEARELSIGWAAVIAPAPGMAADAMTNVVGRDVALVERGAAGPECRILSTLEEVELDQRAARLALDKLDESYKDYEAACRGDRLPLRRPRLPSDRRRMGRDDEGALGEAIETLRRCVREFSPDEVARLLDKIDDLVDPEDGPAEDRRARDDVPNSGYPILERDNPERPAGDRRRRLGQDYPPPFPGRSLPGGNHDDYQREGFFEHPGGHGPEADRQYINREWHGIAGDMAFDRQYPNIRRAVRVDTMGVQAKPLGYRYSSATAASFARLFPNAGRVKVLG